jgi:hypothetical protein
MNAQELLSNPAIDILDSTKLQDFSACRRYGMYQHVFGWRSEAPNNHLVFGDAWHQAMEHLLLNGYSSQSISDAYQLLEDRYRADFDLPSDEVYFPKIPRVALPALAKYCMEYKEEDADFATLHTEVAGSVPIMYGCRLHFKLDSILKRVSTGMISSREHKTGSRLSDAWRSQWGMKIQTGNYQHVLACMYPPEQIEGIAINGAIFTAGLKKAGEVRYERVPVKRSNEMMEVWLRNVSALANEIVIDIADLRLWTDKILADPVLMQFPMNTENCSGYSGCRYMDFCKSWPNPLRYIDTIPTGFMQYYWNPMDKRAEMKEVIDF